MKCAKYREFSTTPIPSVVIAFVRTHPNLVLLRYKGRKCRAITGDCRLAASIYFIRGISAPGNCTPRELKVAEHSFAGSQRYKTRETARVLN